MGEQQVKGTKQSRNNHNWLHWKVKLKYVFELRMFRYSLIKQLKSVSTYIFIALLFFVNVALVMGISLTISIPGQSASQLTELTDAIKQAYQIYIWIYFVIFFPIFSMFIVFKSVQLIRDEIDDGTLLIFSAMPLTRSKMIIEKWLSLQVTSLIFILTTCLMAPGIGALAGGNTLAVVKLIYQNIFFIILTAFIVEILLSTLAILISLSVSTKGTIGILSIIGILSVFGGIVPFIVNGVNSSTKSFPTIQEMNYREKQYQSIKKDLPQDLANSLFDYTAWPYWNKTDLSGKISYDFNYSRYNSYYNMTSKYNLDYSNITTAMINTINKGPNVNDGDQLFTAMKNSPDSDVKQIFDQWQDKKLAVKNLKVKQFDTPTTTSKPDLDKGFGLFDKLYQSLKTTSNDNIFSINKTNFNYQNYSNINTDDATLKSLNNFIQSMYKTGLTNNSTSIKLGFNNDFAKPIVEYFERGSTTKPAITNPNWEGNKISVFFTDFSQEFLPNKYSDLVGFYSSDPAFNYVTTAVNAFVDFMFRSSIAISDNTSSQALTTANKTVNTVNSTLNTYKLLGYLNIWQQWLTMWTNDERAQGNSFGGMSLPINAQGKIIMTPIPYQVSLGVNNTIYIIHPDWNSTSDIINLPLLYTMYVLVSLGLAGVSIWFVIRKDFV